MKAVLVNTLYAPISVGGAERVVRSLALELVRRGDAVTVVTLSPDDTESVSLEEGVKIIRLPLHNVYWPFSRRPPVSAPVRLLWHALDSHNPVAAADLLRILKVEQPDIVHTHNLAGFSSAAFRAVRAIGKPLVHTLHDYYLLCPRSTMYRNKRNCGSRCTTCTALSTPRRINTKAVDKVVGVSRFVLERHEASQMFAPASSRHVISNCLTHEFAADQPAPHPREFDGPLRLGYIGRIEAVKGIESLLGATSLLTPGTWTLTIAGEGDPDYLNELRAKHASPAITFLGRSTLPAFFKEVDLLVVPSLWDEPLGMVAFEAYFFGVPVIAARRGGLPEIVTPDTGLLFDPASPQSLSDLLRALHGDRARLARLAAGATRAASQFEAVRMGDAYRALYTDAIKASAKTAGSRV